MAFFVVEGNIGAGKSTFLKKMGSYLKTQLVYESLEAWQNVGGESLFEAYYKDGKRWAYTFQTYAFMTRIIALEEQVKKNEKPFLLAERSVFADYCFAKNWHDLGMITDLEWTLYNDWFLWLVENRMEKPAGFIYLRADPKICFERLSQRNRIEEKLISLDYLQLIHDKHEAWLIHKQNVFSFVRDVPVLVLDCNKDFESDVALQQIHAQRVAEFVSSYTGLPTSETLIASQIRL